MRHRLEAYGTLARRAVALSSADLPGAFQASLHTPES
jgi:hypothetical protein